MPPADVPIQPAVLDGPAHDLNQQASDVPGRTCRINVEQPVMLALYRDAECPEGVDCCYWNFDSEKPESTAQQTLISPIWVRPALLGGRLPADFGGNRLIVQPNPIS